jgi:predicted dehydrogenase
MSSRLHVGILGCGQISDIYLKNLTGQFADRVKVVAVADVVQASAIKRAEQYAVRALAGPDELFAHDDIDLIANLTPAPVHYATTKQILRAGKHVYSEKPLALTMAEAMELCDLAKSQSVRLAVAPDTILGGSHQTAKHLVDSGKIGTVGAVQSIVSLNVHDERYYSVFRGPHMDLAPYAIAAMLSILGPVKSVTGVALPLQPKPGSTVPASILTTRNPGNLAATLQFESGVVGSLLCSAQTSRYLINHNYFGSAGWLEAADPNMFHGPCKIHLGYDSPVEQTPLFPFAENARGLGIWDIAGAIAEDRPHRLSAEFSLHVLEVMLAAIDSSENGRRIDLSSTFDLTEAMPMGDAKTEVATVG